VSLERFSVAQTAEVLRKSPEDVRLLIDQAREDLKRQASTRSSSSRTSRSLPWTSPASSPRWGTRSPGRGPRERRAGDRQGRPTGLVLADIQLEDGDSGIDAVQAILRLIDVPIIFVTAFPSGC